METKTPFFHLNSRALFTLGGFLFVALLLWLSSGYPPRARYVPQVVAIFSLFCLALQFALDAFPRLESLYGTIEQADVFSIDEGVKAARLGDDSDRRLEFVAYFWLLGLLGGLFVLGFLISIPLYIAFYLRFQAGLSWPRSTIYGALTWLFVYLLFVRLFEIPLYSGMLLDWLLDS